MHENPYATFTASALERHHTALRQEVDRLQQTTTNPRLLGTLPSPTARRAELPGVSEFGRSSFSQTAPLRTLYMDDAVNTQLKQRSWAGLVEAQRRRNVPHPSFDIDGDGIVSIADYKLAKKFDADGNGIIDNEEMEAGKKIIAKELWEKHRSQHFLGKEAPTNADRAMAVDHLVSLAGEHGAFMREYERTKNHHWIEQQRGSSQVLECVSKPKTPMWQPYMVPHTMQVCIDDGSREGRRARTRSELFSTRRLDYANSVRLKTESSPFRVYDNQTITRNYQARDIVVANDVNSFRRI